MTIESTFLELITAKTRDEVLADYLTVLKEVGFPAMSWHATSVPVRLLTAIASVHSSITGLISNVAKGGYVDLATGAWLTLRAASTYKLTRNEASYSQIYCSIADLASVGPVAVSAGQLILSTASGKTFTNDSAFTILLDDVTDFTVTADSTGSTYNIPTDDLITLMTPLPGTGYAVHTEVRTTGTAPPSVTVSGTPLAAYEFIVEITTGGALGVGVFKWSSNGGSSYTTGVTLPAGGTYNPPGTGVTITFSAGTYTTAHTYKWNSGCVSFNPRSDCVAQIGTDEETDELLAQRCGNRWATLGYGSTDNWYKYYCMNTETYGSNVTRVKVDTSAVGTGAITITIAGPSGAVDATTLSAVDDFIQEISPNCATVTVQNASEVTVTPVGTVYVYAAYAQTALAEIEDALSAYLGTVEIGGTVYLSQIEDAIQYDGDEVRNVVLSSPATDTSLTATQVPALGTLAGNLTITSV